MNFVYKLGSDHVSRLPPVSMSFPFFTYLVAHENKSLFHSQAFVFCNELEEYAF
jgi:hypothetical protein